MYIDSIEIENFRTFRKCKIDFCHNDRIFDEEVFPRPRLPNLNLLLANNGYGKTSMLKAIALAALGPAVAKSGIYPYRLIRRESAEDPSRNGKSEKPGGVEREPARLKAFFRTHEQDHSPYENIDSQVEVKSEGDLESLEWTHSDPKPWHPVFSSNSDAFFMVGYGSTRRVSKSSRTEQSGKWSPRAARVMGLFEDDYSLRALNTWLPRYKSSKQLRGRYVQVTHLLKRLVGRGGWEFTGLQDSEGEYLFGRGKSQVPFPALSDGYRAFLGWLGDLLFHICETCPSGKKLVENRGIVMVDEIDLHLHPKWQMMVLETLARELPNIQFIVTSHSPLVAGSLEWMNIILMQPGPRQSSTAKRIRAAVHGLDADQILLTEFFGLESTRAPGKKRKLKDLTIKARSGDPTAAAELLDQMSRGMEVSR